MQAGFRPARAGCYTEPLSVPVGSWKESLPRAEEELSGEGVKKLGSRRPR